MQDNKKNIVALVSLPTQIKIFLATFLIMTFGVCVLLSHTWNSRVDYSFGYLTPFFVLFILYDRYPKMSAILLGGNVSAIDSENIDKNKKSATSWTNRLKVFCDVAFGGLLIMGLLIFLLFTFIFSKTSNWGVPSFATTFGYSIASFAMAYFSSAYTIDGRNVDIHSRLRFVSLFIFPCFIWFVAAPMFGAVEEIVSLFLLSKVAYVVVGVMDFLGFVVELKGNTISFPGGVVGVADACSGIRSLTACLFAGSFLAAAMLNGFLKKVILVALSMGFAFLFNLIRALFLSLWAYENGSDSISGFVHDAAGYFVLGMTVIGLLVFVSIFNINPVPKEFRENKKNKE